MTREFPEPIEGGKFIHATMADGICAAVDGAVTPPGILVILQRGGDASWDDRLDADNTWAYRLDLADARQMAAALLNLVDIVEEGRA